MLKKVSKKRQNSYESAVLLEALESIESMEQNERRANNHTVTLWFQFLSQFFQEPCRFSSIRNFQIGTNSIDPAW